MGSVWQRYRSLNASAVLITVLVVISLAGLGFYMKSLRLHIQVDTLLVQNDKLAAELEKVLMSNQWLTLQNAVVHEDKEILLADAVAQLNEKSQIIE